MANVGKLEFEAFVASRSNPGATEPGEAANAYAYTSDRQTKAAFERAKPVELAVSAAVRLFKNVGKNQLLGQAVKVGPNQFPRVHALGLRCAETLGIAPPTMYIMNDPRANAAR